MGVRLGKGEKLKDIQSSMSAVAEGILTSKSAHHLAEKVGVECHIIEGIYKVSLQKLHKYPYDSFQLMCQFSLSRSYTRAQILLKLLRATCPGH